MARDAQSPYFLAIHRFEVDDRTGDLSIWFLAGDGMHYALTLTPGVVPALLASLIGLGPKIRAAAPVQTGQWENLQALSVQGIRAITHPSGLVGLELQTTEGYPVSILFDRARLPELKESLQGLNG